MDLAKEYKRGRAIYKSYRRQELISVFGKVLLLSIGVSAAARAAIGMVHGYNSNGFFDLIFLLLFLACLLTHVLPIVASTLLDSRQKSLMVGHWVIDQHLKSNLRPDRNFDIKDFLALEGMDKAYIDLSPKERDITKQALLSGDIAVKNIIAENIIFLVGSYEVERSYDIDVLISESDKPISFEKSVV